MSKFAIYCRSKRLALHRRLALLFGRPYDPYPAIPPGIRLSPSESHIPAYESVSLKIARQNRRDISALEWQRLAREKLKELTGYRQTLSPPQTTLCSRERIKAGYQCLSFYLRDKRDIDLPVHAIWKQNAHAAILPVMICLQGTNAGFHLSWGGEVMPSDPLKVASGGDFAIQAADEGYLAVCLEQSCFGLRQERKISIGRSNQCIAAANHLLLLGRCLLGDRVSDVSSVVSWIIGGDHSLPARRDSVSIMGQSSGGTVAMFVGAMDERIHSIMATGCVGYIRETIGVRDDNSGQNVIPGILEWMEMDDVVALCAPRPFLTVSGDRDHIWPISGGKKVVAAARGIYEELDAGEKIAALEVQGTHRFYPAETWLAFAALLNGS